MKDHGLLCSADEVRAFQRGEKTQTRRLNGLKKINREPNAWEVVLPDDHGGWIAWYPNRPGLAEFQKRAYPNGGGFKIPYTPGDRVWARETFCNGCPDEQGVCYREGIREQPAADFCEPKWEPSIHMPKWAARFWRKITDVRIERLQNISEEDAWAEGFPDPDGTNREYSDRARYWFKTLWDTLYAKPRPVMGKNHRISHYVSYPWEDVREVRTHRGLDWYVSGNPWNCVLGLQREE